MMGEEEPVVVVEEGDTEYVFADNYVDDFDAVAAEYTDEYIDDLFTDELVQGMEEFLEEEEASYGLDLGMDEVVNVDGTDGQFTFDLPSPMSSDPFVNLFEPFPSQLHTILVVGASDTQQQGSSVGQVPFSAVPPSSSYPGYVSSQYAPASDAPTGADIAKLSARIEELETSNQLLAADFSTNAEAFWNACTDDILGLCDVDQLQHTSCFASQTSIATLCLSSNAQNIQSQACKVGAQRMTTWYQIHEADAVQLDDAAMGSPAGYYNYYYDTLNTFLNVFIGLLIFLCILRCCTACCVAMKRRSAQRKAEVQKRAAAASKAAKSSRDVVVGVPVSEDQVEDGKFYL